MPDAYPTTQGGPHDASTSTAQDANATAPVPDDSHDNDEDDAHSDASSSGLPPPLITASDYDALICSSCVRKIPILQRWAGTPGVMMVVRDHSSSPWKVLNGDTSNSKASRTATDAESQDVSVVGTSTEVSITTTTEYKLGDKRPLSPSSHDHDITTTDSKKPRTSPPPSTADPTPTPSTSRSRSQSQSHSRRCLAPPVDPTAQRIYASLRSEAQAQAPNLTSTSSSVSTSDVATLPECEGDIFLTDDWRTRWCRCDSVRALLVHCFASFSSFPRPLLTHSITPFTRLDLILILLNPIHLICTCTVPATARSATLPARRGRNLRTGRRS